MRSLKFSLPFLCLAVLCPAVVAAQGGAAKAPEPDVTFEHLDGKPRIYSLDLNHGQRFVVRIDKTCLSAFDYSYEGVVRGRGPEEQTDAPKAKKPLESKDLAIVYDQQYGGYVFHIAAKPGVVAGDECTDGEKLPPLSFIVSVNQRSWNLSFSGGFTVSGLTDPEFSIVTTDGVKNVIREHEKESTRRLGAASFVHLFNDDIQWKHLHPAIGFGLGINDDNRTEYMVGGALRFADKATINVGRVWGSIDRLPNGINFDTPINDDNVLANKGKQVVSRWFFALTYSFIDTKDRLTKPFAPDRGQAESTTEEAASAARGAADKASVTAVQEAAKATGTYKAIAEIAGAVAKGICDATTTGDSAKTVVTVKVKGASSAELTAMQSRSAAAVIASSRRPRATPGGDWPRSLRTSRNSACLASVSGRA
jgi:hypothetical protein